MAEGTEDSRAYCEYFGQRLLSYKRRFGSSDYKCSLEGVQSLLHADDPLLTLAQVQEGIKTVVEMMNTAGFGWDHVSRLYVSFNSSLMALIGILA